MKVLKFGGSSVCDAAHIRKAVSIFIEAGDVRAVICSAMKGVTDALLRAAKQAGSGDESYQTTLREIWLKHETAAAELYSAAPAKSARSTESAKSARSTESAKSTESNAMLKEITAILRNEFTELEEMCRGVFMLKECSTKSLDFIMGFGERLNNRLIAAWSLCSGRKTFYVDARELVIVDRKNVDFSETFRRIRECFASREGIGIVTGYIASDRSGTAATLGRNGSDYSASLFGAALAAECVEIWTDVDGVLEADPSIVPQAAVIRELSIDEAMELSYFGAEVLHPSTMIPAIQHDIPIYIKNTLNPAAPGTRIASDAQANPNIITGIASISRVSLINIVGNGMSGVSGMAMKIFTVFSQEDVNIIMISQASSEHSICIVTRSEGISRVIRKLRHELRYELDAGIIQDIVVQGELEIVSVIGANMCGRPGVAGRIFKTLGDEGINVLAIAQGSSEMNISFVISAADLRDCLQSLHRVFFIDENGDGNVSENADENTEGTHR
ncbi:MAG: aspartate kinase [Salinispira sp.]